MHVHYLVSLISKERRLKEIANVVAIADGGPDWSTKGLINFMTFGFMWKNLNLDTFVIQCYAPGHSRFNPIERSRSFLAKRITTITLPDDIDGEKPAEHDNNGG